jgi:hypothetical protein
MRRISVSSSPRPWSDDWYGRLLERVHQRGFQTVTQYVGERPGVSLIVLADELGPGDVLAGQIRAIFIEDAIRTHTLPYALRDLIDRELRRALPQGWPSRRDKATRAALSDAIANWQYDVKKHLDGWTRIQAAQALMDAELPAGWLPDGPDDPVLIAYVDRCLGGTPS